MTTDSANADASLSDSLSRSTGLIMSKASDLFTEIFETALKPYGLRTKDFTVLTAIDSMGPQSQQCLGQALGIDRTTMVSVVDGLERLRLVDRARDPADRRKYAIGLTEEGQALLHRELTSAMLRSLDGFLEPLTPDEREQVHRLLWRVVNRRGPLVNGPEPWAGEPESFELDDGSTGYGTGHGSTVPGSAGR